MGLLAGRVLVPFEVVHLSSTIGRYISLMIDNKFRPELTSPTNPNLSFYYSIVFFKQDALSTFSCSEYLFNRDRIVSIFSSDP